MSPSIAARLLAGVALSATVAGCVITREIHVEHDDLTFTDPADAVVVDLGAGDLNVFLGEGEHIEIRRTLRYSGPRPELSATLSEGVLELVVECRDLQLECRVDHDVFLPSGASLSGGTGSGAVTVDGVPGNLMLSTGSGDVLVLGATGSVDLGTGSGDILVDDVLGPLTLDTGSGMIEVRAAESTEAIATTGSGDVFLELITSPSRVTVDTGSGDVDLTVPAGSYQVDTITGSGAVSVSGIDTTAGADRVLDVETGSGDITITGAQPSL